jgi:hypothetical protein
MNPIRLTPVRFEVVICIAVICILVAKGRSDIRSKPKDGLYRAALRQSPLTRQPHTAAKYRPARLAISAAPAAAALYTLAIVGTMHKPVP